MVPLAADRVSMDYQPSPIRSRSTKAEYEARRTALYEIVAAQRPMTVRQVFYQATVRGLIDKTELGYEKIQWDLTVMRKERRLPYEWIKDGTRYINRIATYSSPAEALQDAAECYRKSLWEDEFDCVQIWIEKDALTGIIEPITDEYDVPLIAARGYASLSLLHDAARLISIGTAYIYHLGDFDPSGVNAGEKIEETLFEMAPHAGIIFKRLAVTEQQIAEWNLPTRPTKTTDTRAKKFGAHSVELDAIEPHRLRALVRDAIARHLPNFQALKKAEERERETILRLVKKLR
jgi:hypothetical protein